MANVCFMHTSMSNAIVSDCPSAASVTQQQNVTEYWWEDSASTAIPSTFGIVGQRNKRGGITFVETFMLVYFMEDNESSLLADLVSSRRAVLH